MVEKTDALFTNIWKGKKGKHGVLCHFVYPHLEAESFFSIRDM